MKNKLFENNLFGDSGRGEIRKGLPQGRPQQMQSSKKQSNEQ